MTPKTKPLSAKEDLVLRQILELRFGDGTGKNLQIDLAVKEIQSLLKKDREGVAREFEYKLRHGKLDEWDEERGTSILSEKKVLRAIKSKGEE